MNLSLTLLLGFAASVGAYAARPAHVVAIRDFAYKPADLTIQAGESVRFENDDDVAHTITANDASFDSGSLVRVLLRSAPVDAGEDRGLAVNLTAWI